MQRVTLIAACAALGLATTVAIAWAVRPDRRWIYPPLDGVLWIDDEALWTSWTTGGFAWDVHLLHAATRAELAALPEHSPYRTVDEVREYYLGGLPPSRDGSPSFVEVEPADALPGWVLARRHADALVCATGWPFRCLWYGEGQPGDATTRHGAVPLPASWPIVGRHAALPLHVRWPGLLGNVVVLAAAWLGPLAAAVTWRRSRRRRRGLCPACAFDLRGRLEGGCSECGWARGREAGREPARPAGGASD